MTRAQGAADDQKGEGAVEPGSPGGAAQKQQVPAAAGWPMLTLHNRQQGIDSCKLGMKSSDLDLRELAFSTRSKSWDRGLAELLGGADLQHAGHIDAAADDRLTGLDLLGRLSPVRALVFSVELPSDDLAVQRDLFAGLDHDHAAGLIPRRDLPAPAFHFVLHWHSRGGYP